MNFEQLLAALGKLQGGADLVSALTAIMAAKDAEVSTALSKSKTGSKEQKELDKKLKTTEAQLAKVLDHLGIDADDDLDEALAAAGKANKKGGDEALQKRLDKLEKDRKAEKAALEQQLTDERGKRQSATKRSELLKALTDHKAARPDDLVELLLGKIEISEDDSLTFSDEKGTAVKVTDGVKSWLTARPEFVKNSQNPGGGSGAGGGNSSGSGGGDANPLSGAALAKQTATNTKAALTGQAHFFGANG
ncbi:MAG: hypothetical protein AB9917_13685 [Negativicutes bacterium]